MYRLVVTNELGHEELVLTNEGECCYDFKSEEEANEVISELLKLYPECVYTIYKQGV